MMPWDFDCLVDRSRTESVKWRTYEPDVLPMWIADMDFSAPPAVIESLQERISHGVLGYGMRPIALIEVLQERLGRLYGWKVPGEAFVFTPGVVTGFNLAARSLHQPGGELLIQTPVYPPFLKAAGHAGMTTRIQELSRGEQGSYEVNLDEFRRAVGLQTKAFLLCNPHNPVGRVFRRSELEAMAEVCLNHHVPIISDEIHCDLIYPGHEHLPMASLSPDIARQTITLVSPSKTFNLAGLEMAIVIIPDPELRRGFEAARGGMVPASNVLSQVAALAAYRDGAEWLKSLLQYLEANRNVVRKFVAEELPGISMIEPEATFLAWLDCRGASLPDSPAQFFLKHARVALNDGKKFGPGGEGFVRLNFGCARRQLLLALEKMAAALLRRSHC
ncbi:MAG: PatB family C-S lyase [Terriglobia bacterium]